MRTILFLDLPRAAEWMIRGAEKHHPLRFKQHPNWKIQVNFIHCLFAHLLTHTQPSCLAQVATFHSGPSIWLPSWKVDSFSLFRNMW